MYKDKRILAVIPARGGSKGLPGKNIRLLLGRPLVAWTIKQALASEYFDRVIVSTDDKDIARISKEEGAQVPFMRPPELATDTSCTSDAVLHALRFFEADGDLYDYIALLEPTSPLRKRGDIDSGVTKLIDDARADSLVSVGKVHLEHPAIVKKISDGIVMPFVETKGKIYQRQQLEDVYFPYGVLYMVKTDTYKDTKTFYTRGTIPLLIERWQNFEIDDEVDFLITERLMEIKQEVIVG